MPKVDTTLPQPGDETKPIPSIFATSGTGQPGQFVGDVSGFSWSKGETSKSDANAPNYFGDHDGSAVPYKAQPGDGIISSKPLAGADGTLSKDPAQYGIVTSLTNKDGQWLVRQAAPEEAGRISATNTYYADQTRKLAEVGGVLNMPLLALEGAGRLSSLWNSGEIKVPLDHQNTSGAILTTTPGKTTTVVGAYTSDMENILNELGIPKLDGDLDGVVKSFSEGNKGGLNFLNVTQDLYDQGKARGGFFRNVNGPWVDAAAARQDPVTVVSDRKFMVNNKFEITGFGKEINRLQDKHGYTWNKDYTKLLPPVDKD